jgi:predicted metal-binding protein
MERLKKGDQTKKEEEVKEVVQEVKQVPVDTRTTWKKVGGGDFYIGKRLIKPNEIFKAYEEQIPKGFRDVVIALSPLKSEREANPVRPALVTYKVQKRKDSEFFDIVDKSGKVLNTKTDLTEELAKQFVKDLSA